MRKQHQPTDDQRRSAEAMAGVGIPHAQIARALQIDAKTLRLRYRDELGRGEAALARKMVGEPALGAAAPNAPTQKERDSVEAMAGFGVPHEDIARVIRIDAKALRLHYRSELDRGHAVAKTKVMQNLFTIATGTGREAVTASIFWLKCQAGWSEYAAPPAAGAGAPLGKKEQQRLDAETAADDTGWRGLVN